MKIQFSSKKESAPDKENGLQVLYGPSRRVAYKLRWYLILLLAASPLVWLIARIGTSAIWVEALAQLSFPITELRALETGIVKEIPVQIGERVTTGQLLIELDNPLWRQRINLLDPLDTNSISLNKLGGAESLQQHSINLEEEHVKLYKRLHQQGAISKAELLKSEVELNAQRLALMELQRRSRLDSYDIGGNPSEMNRDRREQLWLRDRLNHLNFHASTVGNVAEVLVTPGENVGPGTLMMRIEEDKAPILWIYLQPKNAEFAQVGRKIEVLMPNGEWETAEVIKQADFARRLPAGLNRGFGVDGLSLQVPARFLKPIPRVWQVDRLPLKVRFPRSWPWA